MVNADLKADHFLLVVANLNFTAAPHTQTAEHVVTLARTGLHYFDRCWGS
jgi:hypothetical protein